MFKVDRTVISTVQLEDSDKDDISYWLSKSPLERLIALEILRQQFYQYDPLSARLQRVLSTIEPA